MHKKNFQVAQSLGPIRMLLVEDSSRDIELTLLRLEGSGLQVTSVIAYDHPAAKHALQNDTFDIIVCDYMLPGASGAEVLASANVLAPDTPFIFLSGALGDQQAGAVTSLGAVDYVLKQNLERLPQIISRAILEVRERAKRKAAEKTLLEVEARARIAIEAAEMGVWELDPRTNGIIWDDRCRALYEIDVNETVTLQTALSQSPAEDIEILQKKVEHAMQQESVLHAEYRVLLPGGRVRWIASNGRSFFENGECVRLTGVIQDISERKLATQELVQLNETLGEKVEQRTRERDRTWEVSREMLGVLHHDLSPMTFNPAWEATLGWSESHLTGLRLWELLHPEDINSTIAEAHQLAMGKVSKRFVNRMRHADGTYRWLSWTIVPDSGLMYAAVRDITEERAVLQQLAEINEKLSEQIAKREGVEATLQQMQRLEVVGQLTAGIAHDFNNLLTVILASAAMAIKDFKRGKMERLLTRLSHIKDAGDRGAKLTGQLLSFSRRQRLEPQAIDLNEMVNAMTGLLSKAVGATIHLKMSLVDGLCLALADPTQTEMVILNLAINARDAMPSGGLLRLSTHLETVEKQSAQQTEPGPGSYAVIRIADSGTGMTADVLKRAFEPFFTTKGVGKGSGLGLAQAFGFAKQSGGGVRIDTAIEKGTTVSVYLPIAAGAPSKKTVEKSALAEAQAIKACKILLVDDEDRVREVTSNMLQTLGHTVIETRGGAEALRLINSEIDLVMTDFAMPEMNGNEIAKHLKQLGMTVPVIILTGYADTEELGIHNQIVIQKPFTEKELQKQIDRAICSRFSEAQDE